MQRKHSVFIFAFYFFYSITASSQDTLQNHRQIKVLSWNIYMLPKFIKHTGKTERAALIGKSLASYDYDVIVFQEAFHGKARKIIGKYLRNKYPHIAGPANCGKISLKANSGLWILSRHPIITSHEIVFKNRSGIDAFSRKGAILAEIDVNGSRVQIIGTHLQNSENQIIKFKQCDELFSRLIKPFERELVPQIICGDFNLEKGSDNYNFMLNTLQVEDGNLKGEKQYSYDRLNNDMDDEGENEKQELIDYILFRNNGGKTFCSYRTITLFTHQWHPNHQDLSDHYPLEAGFFLETPVSFTQNFIK